MTDPRLNTDAANNSERLYAILFRDADQIRASLQRAVNLYRSRTGAATLSGTQLRRHLERTGDTQTLQYLDQLAELFTNVQRMNISEADYPRIREQLLVPLVPEGMDLQDLNQGIDGPSPMTESGGLR